MRHYYCHQITSYTWTFDLHNYYLRSLLIINVNSTSYVIRLRNIQNLSYAETELRCISPYVSVYAALVFFYLIAAWMCNKMIHIVVA